jgi:hypothetical protein
MTTVDVTVTELDLGEVRASIAAGSQSTSASTSV